MILQGLIRQYILEQLPGVKGLQPTSIQSYRDAMRLFLRFAERHAAKTIVRLDLTDLDDKCVLAFLDDLERRGNCVATRNQRLSALHGFFEFVAQNIPEATPMCARICAIPLKRAPKPETRYLLREELNSLFLEIKSGRKIDTRDRALLLTLYNTGARASELAQLTIAQTDLNAPAQVRLLGKGRKWRVCPLWTQTVESIKEMLRERGAVIEPESPLFLGNHGRSLTRFGIYKRVRHYAASLEGRQGHKVSMIRVTPHVLRHTAAVHLLEAGVDVNVIRGWLGHASLETTNQYAEITVGAKAEALALCEPLRRGGAIERPATWRRDKELLEWLQAL